MGCPTGLGGGVIPQSNMTHRKIDGTFLEDKMTTKQLKDQICLHEFNSLLTLRRTRTTSTISGGNLPAPSQGVGFRQDWRD